MGFDNQNEPISRSNDFCYFHYTNENETTVCTSEEVQSTFECKGKHFTCGFKLTLDFSQNNSMYSLQIGIKESGEEIYQGAQLEFQAG